MAYRCMGNVNGAYIGMGAYRCMGDVMCRPMGHKDLGVYGYVGVYRSIGDTQGHTDGWGMYRGHANV